MQGSVATTDVPGRTRRPIADGLFEQDGETGAWWLLGSRCSRCAEVVFPSMNDCPNCVSHDTMRPHRIRGRGRVRDFVLVHRGAKGFAVPYVQSFIKLDDGPVIYSTIDGGDPEEMTLRLGTEVEMCIGVVKTIDDVEYLGWTFHPVDAA